MNSVAVICDPRSPEASAVQVYLGKRGVKDPAWYDPRDADEVEQAIRAGQVRRVVFPQTVDFLRLLWDEVLTPEVWQAPGLHVEFAGEDAAFSPAQIAGILAAWETWRHRRRQRRAIAGLILSAVAIAAAWTLVALAR